MDLCSVLQAAAMIDYSLKMLLDEPDPLDCRSCGFFLGDIITMSDGSLRLWAGAYWKTARGECPECGQPVEWSIDGNKNNST